MNQRIIWIALLGMLTSQATVRAEIFTQIASPFVTETYSVTGTTANLSQFDLGATAPNLQNFATAYDDFVLASDGLLTEVSWIGAYDLSTPGLAPDFTVSIFTGLDSTLGSGVLVDSFNVGSANETANGDVADYFSYTADMSGFGLHLTGGTTYWLSVVANLDFGDAGWGWAFSDIGNDVSFQDFGDTSLTRYDDQVDYAFSVTAVPEPGSAIVLVGLMGFAGFRRRRSL